MAEPRRSGGNTVKMIAMVSGCTRPAQNPWITRAMMMVLKSGAPDARKEPAANVAIVQRKTACWPKRCCSQDVNSIAPVIDAK